MANRIELDIPKDIMTYETKLIGPLSLRQLVCGVPMVVIMGASTLFLSKIISSDVAIFAGLVCALPFMLCGWVKIQGLPFEKFAMSTAKSMFLAPAKRKYVIKNTFEVENKALLSPPEDTKSKKKHKTPKSKNPEFRRYR